MTWTFELRHEPEFDPAFPTDPVDWEFVIENGAGGKTIFVTIPGIVQHDHDGTLKPVPEEDVHEILEGIMAGLNKGEPK